MPLKTVGTTTCPECGCKVRVFRRGFLDPVTHRPIFAISLHWDFRTTTYCRGMGKRVSREQIARAG